MPDPGPPGLRLAIPNGNDTGTQFFVFVSQRLEADELFCKEIADGSCGLELSENNESETYALLAAASDECDCTLKLETTSRVHVGSTNSSSQPVYGGRVS